MTGLAERLKFGVDLAAACAMTIAAAAILWAVVRAANAGTPPAKPASASAKAVPAEPISLENTPTKGNRSAPVVMVIFSDFQCPFCGRFARESLPAITADYVDTGRVLLAFKHFPLESIHPKAKAAAALTACAFRRSQFWAAHDALFRENQDLGLPALLKIGVSVGVDRQALPECMKTSAQMVTDDEAEGRRLGIMGTPSFLIGSLDPQGRVVVARHESGALPASSLSAILDQVLKNATTRKR